VQLAIFLAVTKCLFGTLLAKEVFRIHVLSQCPFVVVHPTKVYFAAIVTVVERGLLKHEFEGLPVI